MGGTLNMNEIFNSTIEIVCYPVETHRSAMGCAASSDASRAFAAWAGGILQIARDPASKCIEGRI